MAAPDSAEALYRGEPLPVGSKGRLSSGWWGMITVIGTEASLFAYLLFSYFYVGAQTVERVAAQGRRRRWDSRSPARSC